MERKNVSINGVGTCGGGKYNEICVNGCASSNGSIDCNKLQINGTANFNNELEGELLEVNGLFNNQGKVVCKSIRVAGSAKLKDMVETDDLNIAGRVKIHKNLNAKTIDLQGSLIVGSNVNADSLEGEGVFNIASDLKCKKIDVALRGNTNVKNINSETMTIKECRNHKLNLIERFFVGKSMLNVDNIKANDIEIMNTVAKKVTGNNVTIKKGCNVDLVEYSNELTIEDGAVVKKSIKIL